ncbi:hypothetical protein D9M71_701720 [compost metagenome]
MPALLIAARWPGANAVITPWRDVMLLLASRARLPVLLLLSPSTSVSSSASRLPLFSATRSQFT